MRRWRRYLDASKRGFMALGYALFLYLVIGEIPDPKLACAIVFSLHLLVIASQDLKIQKLQARQARLEHKMLPIQEANTIEYSLETGGELSVIEPTTTKKGSTRCQ